MSEGNNGVEPEEKAVGRPFKKGQSDLTPKQQKFVEEYLLDLNATRAAIRAGYSEKTANPQSSRLLAKAEIQVALQVRRAELAKAAKITPEMIVRELALIGFADMATYLEWGPNGVKLKDSGELPDGASEVVLEVSETMTKEGGTVRFKLHDKQRALESLAKYLGMFVDRKELAGPGGGPIQVREVIINLTPYPSEPDARVIEGRSQILEQGPGTRGH